MKFRFAILIASVFLGAAGPTSINPYNLAPWLGTATVPNKTVFIGSVTSGYGNLAYAARTPQMLASGKIGVYQHANGNSLVGSSTMQQIWNTWAGTGVGPTNGNGQSMGEVGGGQDQREYYTAGFPNPGGNYYPNEVNMDVINGSATYTATSSDKYPGTSYGYFFNSGNVATVNSNVATAGGYGAKNAVPFVFSPNAASGANGYDLDDPFATSGYWAPVRQMALYAGGMVLDTPPSYALNRGSQYISMMEQQIAWGISQGIRVTVLVSPYALSPDGSGNTGPCGYDPNLMESTQNLFGQLKSAGAMPTSWVVLNYGAPGSSCGTENDIVIGDTTPESLNVVALYLARNSQVAPAGTTGSGFNGIAEAGLMAPSGPVAAPVMSLSNAHVGPLNLADVNGYGSMATQDSTDVQITGGNINGPVNITTTTTTPLFENGIVIQGSDGATFANMGSASVISAMSWTNTAGGTVSVTTTLPTHLSTGNTFTISNAVPTAYNGTWTVASTTGALNLTFLLSAGTSPGAVTTLGQISGGNLLTFASTGSISTALRVQGSLDVQNGIYFSNATGASIISGQAPLFQSGLVITGSGGNVFLTTPGASNTNVMMLTVPAGGNAGLTMTGPLSSGSLSVNSSNLSGGTRPGTFSASGPTFGWNYNSLGESDIFLGPGTSTGGINFYALNSSGVVQEAAGSPIFMLGSDGSGNFQGNLFVQAELQSGNTTVTAGSTAAAVPAGGWFKIKIQGTEYRIPLFSTTQAGG